MPSPYPTTVAGKSFEGDSNEVALTDISKSFGDMRALDSVSMTIRAGEVHALCGQNGSGKSTLVKIMTGIYRADSGSIRLWGQDPGTSFAPAEYGIGVIHQDLGLVDSMSSLENFGVSSAYGKGHGFSFVNWRRERAVYRRYSARLGLDIDPSTPLDQLRPADRAMVAIMRALRQLDERGSTHRLLILDEPTVYLPAGEKHLLREVILRLAEGGVAVLIISHELDYVLGLADRVTVLRDGQRVDVRDSSSVDKAAVVTSMIGRPLNSFYPDPPKVPDSEIARSFRGISGKILNDFSLDVRRGEIVGLTGLAGAGFDEFPYLLEHMPGTSVRDGKAAHATAQSPRGRSRPDVRIGVVPANRAQDGAWMEGTVAENLSISGLWAYLWHGLLFAVREQRRVRTAMDMLGVKATGPTAELRELSGGNQQKVVLARWLTTNPEVLVLHEPTQGIDVAANADVFRLIVNAAEEKRTAIVIASNDWEQLAHLCHRVLVLRDGRVIQTLHGDALTEPAIALAAQGGDGK